MEERRTAEKICNFCKESKLPSEFYIQTSKKCKDCTKAAVKIWSANNPHRRKEIRARWNRANRKQKRHYNQRRREELKEKHGDAFAAFERARTDGWRKRNPTIAKLAQKRSAMSRRLLRPHLDFERHKRRRLKIKADPSLAFAYRLSATIRSAIKRKNKRKAAKTIELLGCSIQEFRSHIEKQWKPGMTWDNWGLSCDNWQLDHIRPVSSFDLSDIAQQMACFHYTNYQPLWQPDNRQKGAKWHDGDAYALDRRTPRAGEEENRQGGGPCR